MPTYRFLNTKTDKEWEELMAISEMEEFTKNKHIKLLIPRKLNIVSSVGNVDSKTDSGWKDTLSKISEAHPNSELAKQYGSRKTSKQVKISEVRKKHKDIAKRRILNSKGR